EKMKATGDLYMDILSYLKKQKEANTFKLARELRMDRYKLLEVITELKERGAVAVNHGTVKFLHFTKIGKKMLKRAGPKKRKSSPLPKKKFKSKKSHPKRRA
ncbi:MAG: hypothetical protein KKA79_10665, partial [Nanoarchaeota archaeon]|nr:hypothetical protein [Nanoarchaeota archaeon]